MNCGAGFFVHFSGKMFFKTSGFWLKARQEHSKCKQDRAEKKELRENDTDYGNNWTQKKNSVTPVDR